MAKVRKAWDAFTKPVNRLTLQVNPGSSARKRLGLDNASEVKPMSTLMPDSHSMYQVLRQECKFELHLLPLIPVLMGKMVIKY
jgi:hypothetical protein